MWVKDNDGTNQYDRIHIKHRPPYCSNKVPQTMDLVVFDLDGTLLNKHAEISPFTRDTLALMQDKNISYTVATGRTLHSAHGIIDGHGFVQPHIYSNGVTVWDPQTKQLSLNNPLCNSEIEMIVNAGHQHHITPFLSVVDEQNQHFIYYLPIRNAVEERLLKNYQARKAATVLEAAVMPSNATITNISFLGRNEAVDAVKAQLSSNPQLVAYSGAALEGDGLLWMDIHHSDANKGTAVEQLGKKAGASNIICFGDNDNDLSMIAIANESYAPDNAIDSVKNAVNHVIGHHHKDGVAHFLRERFLL